MVLDVSIEKIEQPKVNQDIVPDLFTVHVDNKRILTILTEDDDVASKWLTEVLRIKHTNTKPPLPGAPTTFPPDAIFVGFIGEEHNPAFGPGPYDPCNNTLDLLTICVGSHCLMFHFPGGSFDSWQFKYREELPYDEAPKQFKAFFESPRVVVLGTDMAKLSKRLKVRHGIKIRNAVDLNQLAVKGMQRHDLDLVRCDFEKLTTTVLGEDFDVIRPEKVYWRRYEPSSQKVMFNTVDAYLRLLVCFKLLDAIDGPRESTSKKSKKKITKGEGAS